MRALPVLAALLLALPACTSGGLGTATVEGQPTGVDEALSLSVVSIDPGSDKTTVEMVAVNGGDRPAEISGRHAPMTLIDGSGQEHAAAEQEIEVPAYSSDRLRVEFAGRPGGDRMTLRAGDVTVPDLPVGATRFEEGPVATAGDLSGAQANHANGSTLRVTGVTFGEATVSVGVEAVNGHDASISLSSRSTDPARLMDERGRTYPLVPPTSNPDLDIAEGQVLRGTLHFAGRVPAGVGRLTLHINQEYGGDTDYARDPRLAIEIPLTSPAD
ncbi:MAG TPA: hypothetical protein VF576_05385 [Rubricoccaceae bacterium]